MAENQEQKIIQAPTGQQKNQEEKNKCCPFLTLPVMTQKQTMLNGKVVSLPEAQLKINLCIKENCSLFNTETNKCCLLK